MTKLGMPFLLETPTIEECFQKAKELNCDFVELNMSFPQNQLKKLKELSWDSIDQNLTVTLHLDEQFSTTSFDDAINEVYLKSLQEILFFAKEKKIPIVNMHLLQGTYVTLPSGKVYLNESFFEEYMQRIQHFREVCDTCLDESEVKICIENTQGWQTYEQKAIQYLLESEHFGLTLDVGHLFTHKFYDLKFIEEHQKRILHMHLHDSKGKQDHMSLNEGNSNWQECYAFAQKQNLNVLLEVKTLEAFEKSLRLL